MDTTNENTTQARALILEALEGHGTEAMEKANQARALVGIDGIERIAVDFANENDVERAYMIRGALDALKGESEPEHGSDPIYAADASDGFDFVEGGGFHGTWAE